MIEGTGDLIVLTGPSGVGKSAVAAELIDRLDGPWLSHQIDLCQPRVGTRFRWDGPGDGGDVERRMTAANHAALAGYVSQGFSVIAELTVTNNDEAESLLRSATRSAIFWLIAEPETITARMATRARRDAELDVDANVMWQSIALTCGHQIPTDDRTPAVVAEQVLGLWEANDQIPPPVG